MKILHSKPLNHLVYWFTSLIVLVAIFGHSWNSTLHAFYFVSMLLPVVLGTSYFFNYFLVPRYLLKNKPFLFALYLFYTLIISLYLELLVLLFSLSYLANFSITNLPPNASDLLLLSLVMYLIVFLGSFLVMMQQWKANQRMLTELREKQDTNSRTYLEITSQRKTIQLPLDNILYIESLSDYVVFVTKDDRITSKEGITKLEQRLPSQFLRIHRSFIVNLNKVTSVKSQVIQIEGKELTIGRSYRKIVQQKTT